MPKLYYLPSCSTCKRIIKELGEQRDLQLIDIKNEPITGEQLEEMKNLAGSYEKLFSRHARKYRSQGLNKQELTEDDYRDHILNEYTFLKRPVTIVGDRIFVGNRPKTTEAAKVALDAK